MSESDTPFAVHDGERIEEMSDATLYEAYQHAKQHGPQLRLDELQLEVAQRWEAIVETECDV